MAHLHARSSASTLATSLCCADLKDSISPSFDRMESIMYLVGCSTLSNRPSALEARVFQAWTLCTVRSFRCGIIGRKSHKQSVSGGRDGEGGRAAHM